MPISLRCPISRISQQEFGEISFEVMRQVFAIHNELGRFFDERIYKQELAYRLPGVRLEEPIDLMFGSFQKRYFMDALVADGGVFEFKAVESLSGQHRAQLLHYLLLSDVAHGKLINIRPEDVEHEYVNTQWRPADRLGFDIEAGRWNATVPGAAQLHDFLTGLLRDLGAGLEIALYEEAVVHCFGGAAAVEADVPVLVNGRQPGQQRFRLIAPGVAVKITAFDGRQDPFEVHARRLLAHVDLRAIAWVNVNLKQVTFTMLER
ncbi:MAG TPA: GxxExxY protein [Planctomycetaceae bacterium]|jgi:GxxExxY protein